MSMEVSFKKKMSNTFYLLPHMFLDKDGIMMTNVTQKMLNLTLNIILSEAIFTV